MQEHVIDGSRGEGGGQILRTTLAVSLVAGVPVRIVRIRAGRKRPGLGRQHLTAVRAAAEIGRAVVEGAELGSTEIVFRPRGVVPGTRRFSVGTAGSTTLVLQTVLPALLQADAPATLLLEGGTHNPGAPPFEFLARTFLPLLARLGPRVHAVLERPGFFPAGGGRIRVEVEPAERLAPLHLADRGEIRRVEARAVVARLPRSIAERELAVVRDRLGWPIERLSAEEVVDSAGPGNVILLAIESEQVTEVVTGFGERGIRAETVAEIACREARAYLESGAPVGPHLADQLLLPLALAGGGSFVTGPPTRHTRTNLEVVRDLLGVRIDATPIGGAGNVRIEIGPAA